MHFGVTICRHFIPEFPRVRSRSFNYSTAVYTKRAYLNNLGIKRPTSMFTEYSMYKLLNDARSQHVLCTVEKSCGGETWLVIQKGFRSCRVWFREIIEWLRMMDLDGVCRLLPTSRHYPEKTAKRSQDNFYHSNQKPLLCKVSICPLM
jgi:hypothetical protein